MLIASLRVRLAGAAAVRLPRCRTAAEIRPRLLTSLCPGIRLAAAEVALRPAVRLAASHVARLTRAGRARSASPLLGAALHRAFRHRTARLAAASLAALTLNTQRRHRLRVNLAARLDSLFLLELAHRLLRFGPKLSIDRPRIESLLLQFLLDLLNRRGVVRGAPFSLIERLTVLLAALRAAASLADLLLAAAPLISPLLLAAAQVRALSAAPLLAALLLINTRLSAPLGVGPLFCINRGE